MPLIILTGYPTSGLTYRANQLATALSELQPSWRNRIHIVPSHTDDNSHPRSVYDESNARLEKETRGVTYSAVKRHLGRESLVIVDGMNYIKGWRYQLWCEARSLGTGCCVVHVGTPIEQCRQINEARISRQKEDTNNTSSAPLSQTETETEASSPHDLNSPPPYAPETHQNLIFRYEEPTLHSRWDKPLFTVLWDDATPPISEIHAVLTSSSSSTTTKKQPLSSSSSYPSQSQTTTSTQKANLATHLPPATPATALYTIDKTTQTLTTHILSTLTASSSSSEDDITLSSLPLTTETLHIPASVRSSLSLPKMQRLRRGFVAMRRGLGGTSGGGWGFEEGGNGVREELVAGAFVRFLEGEFEGGG